MPQRFSPYIRGVLFCAIGGPAIGAVFTGIVIRAPESIPFIFLFGLFQLGPFAAVCAILMVWNALQAAKRGRSELSIRLWAAFSGFLLGGLIGFSSPIFVEIYTSAWKLNRFTANGVLQLVLKNASLGLFLGTFVAISGIFTGFLLPFVLGNTFRDALSAKRGV